MTTNFPENEATVQMMNVNEVARLLRVHPSSVKRWQKSGALEAYRIGPKGSLKFRRENVLKFINNSTDSKATWRRS